MTASSPLHDRRVFDREPVAGPAEPVEVDGQQAEFDLRSDLDRSCSDSAWHTLRHGEDPDLREEFERYDFDALSGGRLERQGDDLRRLERVNEWRAERREDLLKARSPQRRHPSDGLLEKPDRRRDIDVAGEDKVNLQAVAPPRIDHDLGRQRLDQRDLENPAGGRPEPTL
jgi:hypothetical protein